MLVHLRGRVVAEGARRAERARRHAGARLDVRRRAALPQRPEGRPAGSRPFARGGLIHRLPGLGAWTETRDLPPFPRQTFREWWDERRA